MARTDSDSRRNKILQIIIDSYIDTAVPVGSKAVCEKFEESLSSATIRNIMAELEETGYLTHPHTSAGRVPTDKGYRFYVDSLMSAYTPSSDESQRIKKACDVDEKEQLLQRALGMLAEITDQASIMLYPNFKKSALLYIELIHVYANKILFLLVTTSGLVKNTIIDLGYKVDEDVLDVVSNFLNMQFQAKPLDEILPEIKNKIDGCDDSFMTILELSMEILEASQLLEDEEAIDFQGTSNILKKPEFTDSQKAKNVVRALEEKEDIVSIIKTDINGKEHICIHIGSENKSKNLKDCSIIIAPYKSGDRVLGAIGVIGPTRMEYSKVSGRVNYITELISRLLSE